MKGTLKQGCSLARVVAKKIRTKPTSKIMWNLFIFQDNLYTIAESVEKPSMAKTACLFTCQSVTNSPNINTKKPSM